MKLPSTDDLEIFFLSVELAEKANNCSGYFSYFLYMWQLPSDTEGPMNSPVIASFGCMFYKINVLRKLVIAESPVYIQYKVFINTGNLENVLKHSQHLIGNMIFVDKTEEWI